MSFFKDLKDDFSQAVNELLPEEKIEENELDTLHFDDDQIVNTLDEDIEETLETVENEETEISNTETDINDTVYSDLEINNDKDGNIVMDNDNVVMEMLEDEDIIESDSVKTADIKAADVPMEDSGEVTVITKGTIINGSIISDGSLEVMGTIKGDVECSGKLSIVGSVTGNSMAAEVYVNTSRLEGSINSEGSVKIGVGTVVLGDVTASSGVIAGAVKGEIDINGPVVIDSTAVVKGNINAATVQINNGAVIEGFCSLSYSSVDIDNFFEE